MPGTAGQLLGIDSASAARYATLSGDATLNSAMALTISAGAIVDSKVSASAAIAYSKLSLTGSVVNADINSAAAIAYSKLNLTGSLINADLSSSAAIAYSKLATLNTGAILAGNAGTPTATTLGGDATIGATGTLTIANSAITSAKIAASAVTSAKVDTTTVPTLAAANAFTNTATFTVGSNTQAISVRSGASGSFAWMEIGRTAAESLWGVAASAGNFFTGTAAGDTAIRAAGSGKVYFGNANTSAAGVIVSGSSVGFHGAAATAQSADTTAQATTASTQTSPWGFTTQAQADAIATHLNDIRTCLRNHGLMA